MEKTEIGFDKTNTFPIMVKNMFRPAVDGQLEHWMDDKLRATVPPESWDAYCKEWPNAREVCDSLLIRTEDKPAAILQETVNRVLQASQDLPDDSGIILDVTGTQYTENPDHPEEVAPSGETPAQ